MLLLGMILLNPWFVQMAFFAIATYPIGALDENKTVFCGIILTEQASNPSFVMFRSPLVIYRSWYPAKSFGVIHGISPL